MAPTDVRGPKVVVVGSINMDLVVRASKLPLPGETVAAHQTEEIPGGKGANQAVAAARLLDSTAKAPRVAMVGRLGDDAFATRLRSDLESAGVDTRCVWNTPGCPSGLAIVAVEDSGQNAILVSPGSNGRLTPDDLEAARPVMQDADVLLVQLEIPLETVQAAVSIAREFGVRTVLDPAPAPEEFPDSLYDVDVLCPNESEAAAIAGLPVTSVDEACVAAEQLHKNGVKLVTVTLGKRGSVLCYHGRTALAAPFPVDAVDTTAAGDAFAAAIGVRLAEGTDAEDAARFAAAAGALAASRFGAQPAMPTREDVEALLAKHQ